MRFFEDNSYLDSIWASSEKICRLRFLCGMGHEWDSLGLNLMPQVTGWQVCGRNDAFLEQPRTQKAQVTSLRPAGVRSSRLDVGPRPKMAFSLMLPAAELIVQVGVAIWHCY